MEPSQHTNHYQLPSSPPPIIQQQQHQAQQQRPAQPSLFTRLPGSITLPMRTAASTPVSSPGLFSPTAARQTLGHHVSFSETNSPGLDARPALHALQSYKVRETHKALIESDNITGRKLINQYEVIEEIGRGMHGKVKLARNLEDNENVAIKIIPRFSKKRKLGKVTAMARPDKTKKEIAILKKIRHPNVVALLEIIDDPELKKIYMVLEHAEYGEIVWRKKGLPHICQYERRRVEREIRGEYRTSEEERLDRFLEKEQTRKEKLRARAAEKTRRVADYWSVENGAAYEPGSSYGQQSRIQSDEDFLAGDLSTSQPGSYQASKGPSRTHSFASVAMPPAELEEAVNWTEAMQRPPSVLPSSHNSAGALDGVAYGSYAEDDHLSNSVQGRRCSIADSIISHMSSVDFNPIINDLFAEDYSFVPCFTLDQARNTFRDTLLGLEYLHYNNIVHRDIKPANLLSGRDHRVKISDFGVSYFGRPVRYGEPIVSESEARDFDDDLELSKTVGTPAFFAPELCYTDVGKEQPKISELIDIWSLGVTLYCLIFARIPFLAEDEFQMFKKIATEEVHIPRRRLKPVDPSTSPATQSLYKRHNIAPYRNDNDLEYEDIDDDLYDLLRRMLVKDPEHRITLTNIKRHPWVIKGIDNPIAWLDATDPCRPGSDRKVRVDDRDVADAVVPLTFLERARSVMKKTLGKVMHPLVDRSEISKARRRAPSSAASSGDTSMFNGPPTVHPKENDPVRSFSDLLGKKTEQEFITRRQRGDSIGQASSSSSYDPLATMLPPPPSRQEPGTPGWSASSTQPLPCHSRSLSRPNHGLWRQAARNYEAQTMPPSPLYDYQREMRSDLALGDYRQTRGKDDADEDESRSRSVDRGLFCSYDKRATAQTGITHAMVPGDIPIQRSGTPSRSHSRSLRSIDLTKNGSRYSMSSPLATSVQSAYSAFDTEDWPPSNSVDEGKTGSRKHTKSNPESYAMVQEALYKNSHLNGHSSCSAIKGPTSLEGFSQQTEDYLAEPAHRIRPSRGDTMTTGVFSVGSFDGDCTPLTSPSEVTSPASAHTPGGKMSDRMLAFQSDPSLPALLSGASSVSADMESDPPKLLNIPSTKPSLLGSTDSLTPPAFDKEPVGGGFPIQQVFDPVSPLNSGPVRLQFDHSDSSNPHGHDGPNQVDDEDCSGSDDEILLMASSKRRSLAPSHYNHPRRAPFEARRRDTNISTTSVETAKPPHNDESDEP